MTAHISPRTQAALEQISEDESLISDVTDTTATVVINWLTEQITASADQDDATFEQTITQLRRIARSAARSSDDDPATFLAKANAQLATSGIGTGETGTSAPGTRSEQATSASSASATQAVDAAPIPEDPPTSELASPPAHDSAARKAEPAVVPEPAAEASVVQPETALVPTKDVLGAVNSVQGERSMPTVVTESATANEPGTGERASAGIGARARTQGARQPNGTSQASASGSRRKRRRGKR